MTYNERDLIELACRAPAVPEWFKPDMGDMEDPNAVESHVVVIEGGVFEQRRGPSLEYVAEYAVEKARRCLLQWPKAYARMVLEAM